MPVKKSGDKIVLIVEDELPLANAIKAKLEKRGFSTVSARTAEQAYNFLEEIKGIDVIWLDHYLLGAESGLDFLVKIKQHKGWEKIPVFVVSNTAGPEKVKSYLELGATKYIVKAECKLDSVISEVESLLEK